MHKKSQLNHSISNKVIIYPQRTRISRERLLLNSDRVALQSYHDVAYMADILVNGKKYVVVVDTGSSDFWISCSYINKSDCSKTCPSKSITIHYGSGSVCVKPESADIQFGNISIADYAFGIAYGSNVLETSSITTSLLVGDAQGLLGLAYSAIASYKTDAGSLINYLQSFSVYLAGTESADDSFLLLNGVDQNLIATKNWAPYTIPLKDTTHWTLGMTAFKVGEDKAVFPCSPNSLFDTTTSCNAIIDTGTSLLYMPADIYEEFTKTHLEARGCTVSDSSLYMCPTSVQLPRLTFTFGNASFDLSAGDYTLPASLDSVYVELQATAASFSSLTTTASPWIIGATFLKKYYSSYQVNNSVSFYCEVGRCNSNSTTRGPDYEFPVPPNEKIRDGDVTRGSLNNVLYLSAIITGGLVLICLFCSCVRRCCYGRRRSVGTVAGYPGYHNGAYLTPVHIVQPIQR